MENIGENKLPVVTGCLDQLEGLEKKESGGDTLIGMVSAGQARWGCSFGMNSEQRIGGKSG